jgi:hypothetical protein
MHTKKFPENFAYVPEMCGDSYYPAFLVDKLKSVFKDTVNQLEKGNLSNRNIQELFDKMVTKTNELQEEFLENDSEFDTIARDSIGTTIDRILKYFEISLNLAEACREREW